MNNQLLLTAVLGLLLAGCKSEPKVATETPPPRIEGNQVVFAPDSPQVASLVVEAATSASRTPVILNGRLAWDDSVTVRIFTPFAGRVARVSGEVGQSVKRGDVLAAIASPDFTQGQADARRALADEVLARRNLERVHELFNHGAAPRKDLDSAEADLQRAATERQRAEAKLAFYGASTDSTDPVFELKAPIDGMVVERNLNPGQEVRPDQMLASAPQLFAPLYTITDPSHLWLWIDVEEGRVALLHPGQHLQLEARSLPGETFEAVVENISESLDPTTRTARVRASVDNARRHLKAEMLVTVSADVTVPGLAQVVDRALYLKGEKHYVFLQAEKGRFTRREVVPGRQNGSRILIVEGLRPGDPVVVDGALLLEQILQSGKGG
jgi:cobalt-zinc-cadmium efflux system membrane fusion protein